MDLKPGSLYSCNYFWPRFKIKPNNTKDWSEFGSWDDAKFMVHPKESLLYLGVEPWYGVGGLHKFFYDDTILYCKPSSDILKDFKEIIIE